MMIGKHVVVRAVGDEFLSYPSVGHHCIPCKTTKDKTQRVMFKEALDNGLYALVADGVHKVLPKKLDDNAQLYTIPGVCNDTVEVPLLHAVTTKETMLSCTRIFETVRKELEAIGVGKSGAILRVILDFEKNSYKCCKENFR
ncbi:hypothetical protein ANCCAN_20057 [Ancylostoma caninum]|uniref:Uncharacterized protein n=1 Tax=Ancylostoma caninum TaxID=29170 RepID=A0A368FV18_ANCCA|nr:hypothetical protein ANCCAN_20057 [Ancylostoma caninum]